MAVHVNRWSGLKPVVAGVLACASWGAAHAFDDALGSLAPLSSTFEVGVGFPNPTFLDTLSFTLDAPVEGSFALEGQGLVIPGFLALMPATTLTFAIYKGGADLTGWGTSFSGLDLLAGSDYSFKVKGLSGGYKVTWALAPAVPEPETLALALAGVAVIGATARRRLSS
ncbi:MAG: hypothetical protein RLZZ369_1654 [Pseudomonadota bacterium]